MYRENFHPLYTILKCTKEILKEFFSHTNILLLVQSEVYANIFPWNIFPLKRIIM